jgi:hypothetical protein
MISDVKREARRLLAQLERVRADMDRLGIVLTPDGERGYAALVEVARREIEAQEEAIED